MRACAPQRLCWLSGILSAICFTRNRLKSHFISHLLELISAATLCRVAVGRKRSTAHNLTTVHCYGSLLKIHAELTDAEVQAKRNSTQAYRTDAKPDASVAPYPGGTRSSQSIRILPAADRAVNGESQERAKFFPTLHPFCHLYRVLQVGKFDIRLRRVSARTCRSSSSSKLNAASKECRASKSDRVRDRLHLLTACYRSRQSHAWNKRFMPILR